MDLVSAARYSIEELTDAYNQTRVDYLVPMPMSPRRLQEYVDVYDIDLEASVAAVEGNAILGLCMLGLRGERAWLTRLGVLPTNRRRGTGRVMIEYAIRQAIERGASVVHLEVITGNTPAYKLFKGLGFEELRSLTILRRPPGPPPETPALPPTTCTWLDESQILDHSTNRTHYPAWTNQTESLINLGNVKGLHVVNHASEASGWISFERSALQLKRVMLDSVEPGDPPPAYSLLHHLHSQFSGLDTIAENIPVDVPYLDAFRAHRYVESFSRIEMKRDLTPDEG